MLQLWKRDSTSEVGLTRKLECEARQGSPCGTHTITSCGGGSGGSTAERCTAGLLPAEGNDTHPSRCCAPKPLRCERSIPWNRDISDIRLPTHAGLNTRRGFNAAAPLGLFLHVYLLYVHLTEGKKKKVVFIAFHNIPLSIYRIKVIPIIPGSWEGTEIAISRCPKNYR